MGTVADVLPDLPALDRPYRYDATALRELHLGDRVRVPLHGRSVRGWVVGLGEGAVEDLKPVTSWLGLGATEEVVDLARWASWRWAGAWCKLLATASPERVVTELPTAPPQGRLPEVHSQDRVAGRRLVRHARPALVRVGPCTDPIGLVLGLLAGLRDERREGTLLVLAPTVGWAERLAGRLRARGVAAAGPGRWVEARSGFEVVVGTRGLALAPVPALGAALVLDAHDGGYRQTQTPCWHAVGVLAERCRRAAAAMVVTSWCPDPVLLSEVVDHEVLEHEQRFWPRLVVADLAVADPRERPLSSAFAAAAHRALDEPGDGAKVVVVLQRLGGVRLLACAACGALARCEAHRAALHEHEGELACPRGCEAHPRVCIACGRGPLRAVREGVGALTKRVSALLGTDALEVSATTDEVDPAARVLVGTEAVLHRVRRARLVCFADLDDYLCAPRSHAELDALRAIGLAGRLVGSRGGEAPGHVLVQTRLPQHPAVEAAVHGSPTAVIEAAAVLAAELSLPPHVAECALSGEGAAALAESLAARGVAVHATRAGILAVAATHQELCDALQQAGRPAVPTRIEVDPAN